jgi:hypothetical protein
MKYRRRIYYSAEQRAEIWDRGKELADHPRFTLATDVDVYFCDPQSPSRQIALQSPAGNAWQRGSNETPTGFYGNICLAKPTYPSIPKQNSALSQGNSTNARASPCNIKRQQRSLHSVLRRSVESAAVPF